MARPPSPLDLSLHTHFGILAQRRRGFFRDPDKAAIETRRVPIGRRSPSRDQPLPRRVQSTVQALRLDRRSKQNHRRCQTRAPSVRFDPLEPIGPVRAACFGSFFGSRTLDFSKWAQFEPTESSDWTEFFCAIVAKS